jgi:hypothetical protein
MLVPMPNAAAIAFGAAAVVLIVLAVARTPRTAGLSIACIVLSIAPVVWVPLIAGSSAGNRFLYFAGAWMALILASGIRTLPRPAGPIAFAIIAALGIGSVAYQARVWRLAAELSRTSIEQLRPFAGTRTPIYIENLPGLFTDGPYVINSLAFGYYFHGALPPVTAHVMAVKHDGGEAVFAFWMDDNTLPAGARAISLSTPVWLPESHAVIGIDTPRDGDAITEPFTIRGWAIDANARAGNGVDLIRVYAYPATGTDEQLIGTARIGLERPDIAQQYGSKALRSGFMLEARDLPPGHYRIVVFARMTFSRKSGRATVADVLVKR